MRLIDADVLKEKFLDMGCLDDKPCYGAEILDGMPTVDVLDKIRAEIEEVLREPEYQHEGEDWGVGLCIAQEIIDKYTKTDRG